VPTTRSCSISLLVHLHLLVYPSIHSIPVH
jgi:hypothetical protein